MPTDYFKLSEFLQQLNRDEYEAIPLLEVLSQNKDDVFLNPIYYFCSTRSRIKYSNPHLNDIENPTIGIGQLGYSWGDVVEYIAGLYKVSTLSILTHLDEITNTYFVLKFEKKKDDHHRGFLTDLDREDRQSEIDYIEEHEQPLLDKFKIAVQREEKNNPGNGMFKLPPDRLKALINETRNQLGLFLDKNGKIKKIVSKKGLPRLLSIIVEECFINVENLYISNPCHVDLLENHFPELNGWIDDEKIKYSLSFSDLDYIRIACLSMGLDPNKCRKYNRHGAFWYFDRLDDDIKHFPQLDDLQERCNLLYNISYNDSNPRSPAEWYDTLIELDIKIYAPFEQMLKQSDAAQDDGPVSDTVLSDDAATEDKKEKPRRHNLNVSVALALIKAAKGSDGIKKSLTPAVLRDELLTDCGPYCENKFYPINHDKAEGVYYQQSAAPDEHNQAHLGTLKIVLKNGQEESVPMRTFAPILSEIQKTAVDTPY